MAVSILFCVQILSVESPTVRFCKMSLRTKMGSSRSTYLEQNYAPDHFRIVVEAGDPIKVPQMTKKHTAVLVTIGMVAYLVG